MKNKKLKQNKKNYIRKEIDKVYKKDNAKVKDFVFDESVTNVFPDMLSRSVPAYDTLIKMIGVIAGKVIQKKSNCYDLGCSLGGATTAVLPHAIRKKAKIIAVDSSPAMIKAFKENIRSLKNNKFNNIDLYCQDIKKIKMKNASLVILNLTLQFIPLKKRESLLKSIYESLLPKGAVILTEKVSFSSSKKQKLFTGYYEEFKRSNGYSNLEISQKRSALEKVLLPETIKTHKKRLKQAGFKQVDLWFQSLNFVSFICIK